MHCKKFQTTISQWCSINVPALTKTKNTWTLLQKRFTAELQWHDDFDDLIGKECAKMAALLQANLHHAPHSRHSPLQTYCHGFHYAFVQRLSRKPGSNGWQLLPVALWLLPSKFERRFVDLCDQIQPSIESYVESSSGIYIAMDCLSSRIRIPWFMAWFFAFVPSWLYFIT